MTNHPGQTMTIYDIPVLVAQNYPLTATPKNIQSGFRVSETFLFNSNIFDEIASKVIDKDLQQDNRDPDIIDNPEPGSNGFLFQTDELIANETFPSK